MKYRDMEIVQAALRERPSHTVVYVKNLRKRKKTEQKQEQKVSALSVAASKLFWQAVFCFTLFSSILSLKLMGGDMGRSVSAVISDAVGYNIEALGAGGEDEGINGFAAFFGFLDKPKLPITLKEAVPDGEYMVFNDNVLYLTDHETFVFASMGGTVSSIERDGSGDITLKINGGNYTLEYKKLEFCSLNEGDVVETGTMVGSFSKSGLQLRVYYKGKPVEKLSSKIIWEA